MPTNNRKFECYIPTWDKDVKEYIVEHHITYYQRFKYNKKLYIMNFEVVCEIVKMTVGSYDKIKGTLKWRDPDISPVKDVSRLYPYDMIAFGVNK